MSDDDTPLPALSDDELAAIIDRIDTLPPEVAMDFARLAAECRRARSAEARLAASSGDATARLQSLEADITQVVLDAAEWLRTLWTVGYMGAARFPAEPKSEFPSIEVEDILKSALLSRIRQGKRPLPFPPPTRHGVPWHEIVEKDGVFAVDTTIVRDENGVPLAASIDGCNDWQLVSVAGELAPDCEFVVQHAGKGPLYRLHIEASGASTLTREAPDRSCRILTRERAGITVFLLEWPQADGEFRLVPLRATSRDRAEAEANHWVAENHPERYGQLRFVDAVS